MVSCIALPAQLGYRGILVMGNDTAVFSQLSASVLVVDSGESESWSRVQANEHCRGVIVKIEGKPVDFLLRDAPNFSERLDYWKKTPANSDSHVANHLQQYWQQLLASLTIVVCATGQSQNLRRCLQALLQHSIHVAGSDQQAQILVVDSAPIDEHNHKVCQEFPSVRYELEQRPGMNFARNRAIEEVRGELLAYIDQDVQVDRGWLSALLNTISENPDASAYSGQVLPVEIESDAQLQFEQDGGFRLGFKSQLFELASRHGFLYPCDAGRIGSGVNAVFRRSILRQLWGFDEALNAGDDLPGGGASDLFYRLLRAGHSIAYDPGILVFHDHPRDMDELAVHYRDVRGKSSIAAAVKNFRTDHQNRPRLTLYLGWWFSSRSWRLLKSVAGKYPVTPGILAGELVGGLSGLFGAYGRSCRRVREIKRQHPRSTY